jgi:GT2 family glycosyltransferase/glycosyltransferase involved in cell wall biosynthesis
VGAAKVNLVCVTGMHRSGTSLVSRIVNLLGVDLGPEEDLLPAAPDNPRGFWENRAFKRVNDQVLEALGGTWDRPPSLPPDWEYAPVLEGVRKTAIDAVGLFSASHGWTGWKDPRASLTLPFWRTITPIHKTVITVRSPGDVARSLAIRNGFSTEKSAELWARYVTSALVDSPDHLLVDYVECLEHPQEVAQRLATYLGLPSPTSDQRTAVVAFVGKDLQHHRDVEQVEAPGMALAETIYRLIQTAPVAEIQPLFEQVRNGMTAWIDAQHFEDERRQREEQIEDERRHREEQIEGERRQRSEEIQSLHVERDEARSRLAEVERELLEVHEQSGQWKAEAERSARDLQAAQEKLASLQSRLEVAMSKQAEWQRRYKKLSSRRSVRSSLAVAELARPAFVAVRRARSRRRNQTAAQGTPGAAAVTPAPFLLDAEPVHVPDDEALLNLSQLQPVTVIIPVFNAPGPLRRCVDSVVRHTGRPFELLLIDDASTDSGVQAVLADARELSHTRVLVNDHNIGFVGTVNRGFEATAGDVVVLNSDTVVGPHWLDNLCLAAYSAPEVATATALTDNGGAFAVPVVAVPNPLPAGFDATEAALLVHRTSERVYPETPTGNAFCMYVKRAVLDAIGGFDIENFPRGYGEENDFCMRAGREGWRHVVDDATLVLHERGVSFGSEREALMKRGREMVNQLHPDYTALVGEFGQLPDMARVRRTVDAAYRSAEEVPVGSGLRLLFVIHDGTGGTPYTNEDLMEALQSEHECFVLRSNTRTLRFGRMQGRDFHEIDRLEFEDPIEFGEFSRPTYRDFVVRMLLRSEIDLVHVRHLIKHTFDAPMAAADLNIPVVMSFHDYYLSCPTVHLLDDQDRFCGGVCTPGQGSCRIPSDWLKSTPHLKHAYVHVWRAEVSKVLKRADAFVTTSFTSREVYRRSYPALAETPFAVIEHGRDIEQNSGTTSAPLVGGPVRILVPGNLDVHKGSDFIRALKALDVQGRLDFHFLGGRAEDVAGLGKWHGSYQRHEFVDKVRKIQPSFLGLFSIWAETYVHTLTEAWAAGAPVIASDIGALKERIEAHGGGYLIDHDDPARALQQILQLADDPSAYQALQDRATAVDLPRVRSMADAYQLLYRQVLRGRQHAISPAATSKHRGRPLVAEAFVAGADGQHPGSVHVRTLRRLTHPSVADRVVHRVANVDGFLNASETPAEFALVQRNALPPARVDAFLDDCTAHSLPIVVDLDDNLVTLGGRDDLAGEYGESVAGMRRLLAAATLVTVSTPRLQEELRGHADDVVVVPNQLDERLWFGGLPAATPLLKPRDPAGPVQLLYMGTMTHGGDLRVLEPALEALQKLTRRPVRLSVIGGERLGAGQNWYQRIAVPAGYTSYPRFVSWLRANASQWDLAVAPLEHSEFNAGKSDLKFLEYSALGLPGVYSDYGPYQESVVPDELGLLADADPRQWAEQLARLCNDAELRRDIGSRVRNHVRTSRTLGASAESYVELLFSKVGAWEEVILPSAATG